MIEQKIASCPEPEPSRTHRVFRPSSLLNDIVILTGVVLPFAATIVAIGQLWEREVVPVDIVLLVGMYLLTGFGITIGYHRFATHRAFQSNPVAELVLLILGSMALEGSVLQWVATH